MNIRYFVGIDVALAEHRCGVLDGSGEAAGRSFSFPASRDGFKMLREELRRRGALPEISEIGVEATGHLWENLEVFLVQHGYTVRVFNPLLTRRFRDLARKRAKTDDIDAYLIAGLLRAQVGAASYVPDETVQSLRELTRFRAVLLDNRQDLRRRIIALLQVVFPEYSQVFSDPLSVSARAVFHIYPTADVIARASRSKLIACVVRAGGRGFTPERADKLRSLAQTSIYSGKGRSARALSLRVLLEQFEGCQHGMDELEAAMEKILQATPRLDNGDPPDVEIYLSFPGIGPQTAAALLGEWGNLRRFTTSKGVVAYVGYYPRIEESGTGACRPRLWHGGSRVLRRTLYMAAVNAVRYSPEMRTIYLRKRSQGKAPKQALIVVAVKLTTMMWSAIRHRTLYDPHRVLLASPSGGPS